MMPRQRVEMWIELAREASTLAPAYAAGSASTARDAGLDMRLSAARGLTRGLNFHQLPYSAWETGREFLFLLDTLVNDDNPPEVRLGAVNDLVVVAGRLADELRTCVVRTRADLDD
jgi:hypothetical protein